MEDVEKELYTNENILKVLERILEIKIKKLDFIEKEYFDSISEYDFSLLKYNMTYNDDKEMKIYLKMIKSGKIKESIFCFWSLIYEEYLKDNNKNILLNKKVIIKQKKANENDSNIVLTFDHSLDYCAEINMIELRKIVRENKKVERWLEEKEIKSEDILFVGRKNVL